MVPHQEKESFDAKTDVLTVRIPEDLMEKIRAFCGDNDIPIEQFAVDALTQRLSRWKE